MLGGVQEEGYLITEAQEGPEQGLTLNRFGRTALPGHAEFGQHHMYGAIVLQGFAGIFEVVYWQ